MSTGHEVDFIVGDPEAGQATQLLQVCADLLRPDTKAREVHTLEAAMDEVGIGEATIVTMHHAEDLSVAGGAIHVVPAWARTLGL